MAQQETTYPCRPPAADATFRMNGFIHLLQPIGRRVIAGCECYLDWVESERLIIGLVAAVTVPTSIPAIRMHPWCAAFSCGGYAAYIAFPLLTTLEATLVTLVSVGAVLMRYVAQGSLSGRPRYLRGSWWQQRGRLGFSRVARGWKSVRRRRLFRIDLIFVVSLLMLTGWMASDRSPWRAFTLLADNNKFAIVVSGLLLAAFAGNDLVLIVVRPYIQVLEAEGENLSTLMPVGLHIGWIERSLTFAFICGGFPEAAALAIAARSLARLPEVQRHTGTFAQYVVVGTLANLAIATAIGVLVRLCLRLPPL